MTQAMRDDLPKLIARIEAAFGPDDEIDCAIGEMLYMQGRKPWECFNYGKDGPAFGFTKSVDAALTLASNGAGFSLERRWNREGVIWIAVFSTGGVPLNPLQQFASECRTASLAVCAAALKMREVPQ